MMITSFDFELEWIDLVLHMYLYVSIGPIIGVNYLDPFGDDGFHMVLPILVILFFFGICFTHLFGLYS